MADADSTNTPQWSTAPLPVAEERLPSLAIALDPERMKAVFAPWVHERFGDAGRYPACILPVFSGGPVGR